MDEPQDPQAQAGDIADELIERERARVREALQRTVAASETPPQKAPGWILAVAALLALAVGGCYFYQLARGLEGIELLRFTSLYVAVPLGLAVLLVFVYFRKAKRG